MNILYILFILKGVDSGFYLKTMIKILLCDDSITVRKKLGNSIRSLTKCTIVEAKNGNEAVEQFNKETPDLVFMDIMMPEKDGLEAVAEIMTLHQEAKIIMLSSVGTKSNLQKALKFGALDFVQKPVDLDRLQTILETYTKEV